MDDSPEVRSRAVVFSLLGHESEAVAARFGASGFSRHFHDTYSFGLVLNGVSRFGYRRRMFEAEAGSIGICDPGEVHDGGMARVPWAYRSAFPSAAAMAAVAAELGMDGLPAFNTGHLTDPLSIKRLHRFLALAFDENAGREELDEAGVDAFATIVSRNAVGVRPAQEAVACPRVAAVAINMIRDAPRDDVVRLADMASAADASRFQVIRSVAQATGLTPHAYLVQLRTDWAKARLRDGVPIAVAAAEAGFADQSHFSRALTSRWGVTPGAFARAYKHADGGERVVKRTRRR